MKDSNVRTRTAIEAMQGTLPQPHFNAEPVALAVRPSDAIQLGIEDRVDGTQALTREDLQIPRLALVQAQSSDIPDYLKHLGEWHNNLTGEFAATIQAVHALAVQLARALPALRSGGEEPGAASR